MKKTILILAAICGLSSCSTPERTAQASAIADLALTYAVASGKITPEDAALVRSAKTIVLPAEAPAVDVTSTK
jgi:uncharacterized lipoprotein